MVGLDLVMDGTREPSGESFDPAAVLYVGGPIKVIGMPEGTTSGKPTVMLRATLPDGREVFIETTLALFVLAADALRAHYGQP